MSPREPFPRSAARHEAKAAEVLRRFATAHGWSPTLPVPVELIVEVLFDLRIAHAVLPEPAGDMVLGALAPAERTIYLNEAHAAIFDRWIGPERFTLAHELGHWLYDADDPDQLDLLGSPEAIFCRGGAATDDRASIRERNADGFAARLLMPEDLVRPALAALWPQLDERALAASWGVSVRALQIRAVELGFMR